MLEDRSDDTGYTNEIRVYPNPANDLIYMKLPEWVQTVEIHSLDGRQWKQLQTPGGGSYTIGISDIPSGIYTLLSQGGKNKETKQLIITR